MITQPIQSTIEHPGEKLDVFQTGTSFMITVTINDRSGHQRIFSTKPGQFLMDAVMEAGIDVFPADCRGCCACATCHVYVNESFSTRLPAMYVEEDELLESSIHRRNNSRLSCQLPLTAEMDGLIVTLAPNK